MIYKDILFAFVFLIIGTVIYWIFNVDIYIFKWLNIELSNYNLFGFNSISKNLRNYLSDFFWCLYICQMYIVLKKIHAPVYYQICLLLLPFVSEFMQLLKIINGSFDFIDVFIYLVVVLVYLLKFNYEKNI